MKKAPKTSVLGAFVVQTRVLISDNLALGELRSTTCCLETVLRHIESCFPWYSGLFRAFRFLVILCGNQEK